MLCTDTRLKKNTCNKLSNDGCEIHVHFDHLWSKDEREIHTSTSRIRLFGAGVKDESEIHTSTFRKRLLTKRVQKATRNEEFLPERRADSADRCNCSTAEVPPCGCSAWMTAMLNIARCSSSLTCPRNPPKLWNQCYTFFTNFSGCCVGCGFGRDGGDLRASSRRGARC